MLQRQKSNSSSRIVIAGSIDRRNHRDDGDRQLQYAGRFSQAIQAHLHVSVGSSMTSRVHLLETGYSI